MTITLTGCAMPFETAAHPQAVRHHKSSPALPWGRATREQLKKALLLKLQDAAEVLHGLQIPYYDAFVILHRSKVQEKLIPQLLSIRSKH